MAIVINGSGTVTGLAVGGLPDGTVDDGTVASGIASSKLTGALPAISGASLTGFTDAQMPAGSVLQVLHFAYESSTTSASSTYADTGLTLNITPSSTSSKILVSVSHPEVARVGSSGPSESKLGIQLMRGSTVLTLMCDGILELIASTQNTNHTGWIDAAGPSITYLDSPSSTSALTYKTQLRNSAGNTNGVRIVGSGVSRITLMEIAG